VKKTIRDTIRKPIQKRAQATVEAILSSTTRILEHDGFDKMSTNTIAEKAGVGIASLYQYFRNKDQIIHALVQKMVDRKMKEILGGLDSSKIFSLEDAVSELMRVLIDSKKSNSKLERILETQIPSFATFKLMEKFDQELIQVFKKNIEPYRQELNSPDLEYSLFIVLQAIKGVFIMTNATRPQYLDSPKLQKILTAMVLSGLKA